MQGYDSWPWTGRQKNSLIKNGDYAYRRDIEAGRRNNRFMEGLSGLKQGDRVITSSYSAMQEAERIALGE